jgi:hypothetical protein
MKKSALYLILLLIGFAILFSACQPKIYGQVKRKKNRKCGCELVQPNPTNLCALPEKMD